MIVVTISLWPNGDRSREQHLGTACITNDGTGDETTGNYDVLLSTKGDNPKPWRRGKVEGFPRKRLGAWDLLLWALVIAVGDRWKGMLKVRPR